MLKNNKSTSQQSLLYKRTNKLINSSNYRKFYKIEKEKLKKEKEFYKEQLRLQKNQAKIATTKTSSLTPQTYTDLPYLVKLEGVNKFYQSGDEKVHALKDISLELPKSGLVFVLGQSGCGKSTLLNILGGLDKPDEGRILIEGADFSKFTSANLNDYLNSYLGFIFQEYNILKDLNLYDNIALPLEMQNVNKREIKQKTLEIIDQVGLSELRKRKINQLSGGQRQRIAVARALIKNPKMIIADEPTGNLDSVTGETIFELLKKLSEDRLVLIVTHDEESAYKFGDRIIKIEDGQLVEDISAPFTENDKNPLLDATINEDFVLSKVISTKNRDEVNENGKLKLIKVSTPVGTSFKLALKNINHKKFRFILMTLICSLSLAFFSFTIELNDDPIRQNVYTSVDNNYIYADLLEKSELPENYVKNTIYDDYIGTQLPNDAYEEIKTKIPSLTVHEYKTVAINYADYTSITDSFFTGELSYLTKYDSRNSYKLLYGRTPTPGTKEIMITDYLAEMFMRLNYLQEAKQYSDFVGRFIQIATDNYYKIVGIIDTNFEKYTQFSKSDMIDDDSKLNFAFFNEYKMMNTIYLNNEDFLLESNVMSNKVDLSDVTFDIKLKGRVSTSINHTTMVTDELEIKSVISDRKDENGAYVLRNIGRQLNHNAYEIIVPYNILVDLFNLTSREPTSFNEYNRSWNRLNKNITLSITNNKGEVETLDVTIVGVTQLNGKYIGVSNKVMEFLFNNVSNSSYLLAEVSPFENIAYEQFQTAYDEGYILDLFAYRSDIDSYEISPFVNLLSKAGLFVFAVFTIGILWTIISLDIVDQKKEIGTFRSIGLSGFKVSLLFIFQTLVICIISYVIALLVGNYAIQLFDSTIYDSENLIHLSMYMMTYRSPVFLIIFLLVITSIALILPLSKIMSQKIIDVINERGEL